MGQKGKILVTEDGRFDLNTYKWDGAGLEIKFYFGPVYLLTDPPTETAAAETAETERSPEEAVNPAPEVEPPADDAETDSESSGSGVEIITE